VHDRVEGLQGRTLVVGDVHGCYDELLALLDRVRYDPAADSLVFVGDLVMKGPKNLEVLQLARELRAFAVRGNNDDAALNAWLKVQEGRRIKAKSDWVRDMGPDDAQWLGEMPFTLALPALRTLIVHAGLVPGRALRKQRLVDLYKMRTVYREGGKGGGEGGQGGGGAGEGGGGGKGRWRAVQRARDETGILWGSKYQGMKHVFFGHDALQSLQRHAWATGLDTGCVYGGTLTAAVLPPEAEALERAEGWGGDRAPSLAELGATLESVDAFRAYWDVAAD